MSETQTVQENQVNLVLKPRTWEDDNDDPDITPEFLDPRGLPSLDTEPEQLEPEPEPDAPPASEQKVDESIQLAIAGQKVPGSQAQVVARIKTTHGLASKHVWMDDEPSRWAQRAVVIVLVVGRFKGRRAKESTHLILEIDAVSGEVEEVGNTPAGEKFIQNVALLQVLNPK